MSTGPRSTSAASATAASSGGGTVWPFSSTTDPRAALAPAERQRHTELIRQSHERCAALGLMRIEQPDYTPLLKGDLTIAIERNQRLLAHATPVMELLFDQIVDTQSMIVLTDCQGTILHALGDDEFLGHASKVALAPGVNWAEQSKGTNGMGTTLFSEAPTLVHADEHFMHANDFLTCSASPIFDPRGNILGVLDVTSDHRAYHRHTMGLVRMSARMIENHWLTEDFRTSLRLHFHPRPDFIGSLLEGIAVLNPEGRFLGANRSAQDLLDLQGSTLRMRSLVSVFGITVNALADHFRSPLADPMKLDLPNGRSVYVEARFGWARLHALRQAAAADTDTDMNMDTDTATPLGDAPADLALPGDPERASGPHSLRDLRTGDPQMDTVVDKVQRILDRDITLLLLGEKGTGKELLARAFHHDSARAARPFVPVDCASIPQTLLEAELLGYADSTPADALHEKAVVPPHKAQSGAKCGRIVQAHGGTLFLNEIGDLPLPLQARLLRVLRDRCVYPLGADHPVPVNIAVVAATHRNLRDMIERGEFREDLYYRLNGLVVRLPPLRERIDLLAIAQRMLKRESPRQPPTLGAGVLDLFQAYHWPGNLRQLGSVLRTAVAMAENEALITEAHLSDDLLEEARGLLPPHAPAAPVAASAGTATASQPAATPQANGRHAPRRAPDPGAAFTRPLEEVELEMIRQAVEAAGGNISMASKRLGISRNTIYRKLRWKQP